MWDSLISLAVKIIFKVIEFSENRKLSQDEFIDYIRKHQKKVSNAGKSAQEWDKKINETSKDQ